MVYKFTIVSVESLLQNGFIWSSFRQMLYICNIFQIDVYIEYIN